MGIVFVAMCVFTGVFVAVFVAAFQQRQTLGGVNTVSAFQQVCHKLLQAGTGENNHMGGLQKFDLADMERVVVQTRYTFTDQTGTGQPRTLGQQLCKLIYG